MAKKHLIIYYISTVRRHKRLRKKHEYPWLNVMHTALWYRINEMEHYMLRYFMADIFRFIRLLRARVFAAEWLLHINNNNDNNHNNNDNIECVRWCAQRNLLRICTALTNCISFHLNWAISTRWLTAHAFCNGRFIIFQNVHFV